MKEMLIIYTDDYSNGGRYVYFKCPHCDSYYSIDKLTKILEKINSWNNYIEKINCVNCDKEIKFSEEIWDLI